MTEEPSVLDYLKAKLTPWRGPAPQIPPLPEPDQRSPDIELDQAVEPIATPDVGTAISPDLELAAQDEPATRKVVWPWRAMAALGVALIAQWTLEPGLARHWAPGLALYLLAFILIIWATQRSELVIAQLPKDCDRQDDLPASGNVRKIALLILALVLALFAFRAFTGNRFTTFNVWLWILSIIAIVIAFWQPNPKTLNWKKWAKGHLNPRQWQVERLGWGLLLLAVTTFVLFFRLYRTDSVPLEMVSDHAEKLLDVWDVLQGKTSIFFPRNTGREGLQMYMTAGIIQLLGTGYSYLSLKIGTVIAGIVTLPFVYLLGKEVGNRRVGLLALLFAGIAYWPNVISRVGLRFPLYPLFVAPTLYFLLRGLHTSNRNYFILSGIFLGIGLHGYTPIRILPIVILVVVGLYLMHPQSKGKRRQAIWGLVLLVLISLIIFLPLLRFALEEPYLFSLRSFSRLGSVERPLPGPAWQIFLSNLWNAMTMFAWDNGDIWLHSVAQRPALDTVSAALFYMGGIMLLVRYLEQRNWFFLFLLLSVPLLMLPSILSLAFPEENPALNRMSGAMIPVFLIVAIALDAILTGIESRLGNSAGKKVVWGLALLLVAWSSFQNFDLVFNQYQDVHKTRSWNTSEMGEIIREFTLSKGSTESAYVVPFPHWVDTRLVGMNAGFPRKDFAIWPDALADTTSKPGAKLFLVKPDDQESLISLRNLYPQGNLATYNSEIDAHDFVMFFIPADE
ncbi:MAG: glycosyltransferase family 39 protein [Anaerolineaceae bacterium]|nr:MAG: glycosyltransferase family 39 protein [Anaerolineaceae bacterium]